MRFLIIFIFLITNSFADEVSNIKNLIINKELKKYEGLTFFNAKNEQLNFVDIDTSAILLFRGFVLISINSLYFEIFSFEAKK